MNTRRNPNMLEEREREDTLPPTPSADISASRLRRIHLIASFALAIVSIVYLVQIATPLRLINDGVDYLLQASSAIDGHGFLIHGERSMRPPGYPALIFLLAKVGLGTSWAIVALNCFLLGIGCGASYVVLRESLGFPRDVAQCILVLTLLSFVMIRNVTYPLSDVCFFGTSVPAVLILRKTEGESGSRRLWRLLLLLPLIFLCIELRTIGIALIPAFLWAAIGGAPGARKIYPVVKRHRFIAFAILLAALLMIGKVFLNSRYWLFNSPIFLRRGFFQSIVTNVAFETTEWGEMAANVPASRLPGALGFPLRILGLFAIFTFAVGIWSKRDRPDSQWLYTLGFAAIVFAYPWNDARLWLPVLPFLMGYVLLGLRRMMARTTLRPLLVAYGTFFCLLGVLALGYSTRLTFAGARFPELYGDGNLRRAYQIVLRGETPKAGESVDPDALYLLRRYEWRAAKK